MLRLLLDSHTLFWAVSDAPALSPRARTMILDQDNEVFYSPVNLYELVFKAHRGRAPAAARLAASPKLPSRPASSRLGDLPALRPEHVAEHLRRLGSPDHFFQGHLMHAAQNSQDSAN